MTNLYALIASFLIVLLGFVTAKSQNVGVGTSSPNQKLEVAGWIELGDETEGTSGTVGTIRYHTDKKIQFFDGTQWIDLPGSPDDNDWTITGNDMYNQNSGNVGIGVSDPSATLHIFRPDTEVAMVYATGSNQGSGYFYAGQSLSHGGGFAYDGDGSPDIVGGTDRVTFFRRTNSVDYDVLSYVHNSDEVRMTNLAGSGTVLLQADNDGDIQKKAYSGSGTDVLTGAGTWVNIGSAGIGDNLGNHTATTNINANDYELQNVKALQGKDWDDDSGGSNNKYRLLFRDGAHQFYEGGVVVGSYGNGTWSDLADGTLIVENNAGINTTSVRSDVALDVNGAVGTSRMGIGGTYDSYQVQGLWSIAPNYKISTSNNDFGNQYGITYAHTNAGSSGSKKPIPNWGHQILFTSNGDRNAVIGLSDGHGYFAGNVGIGVTAPAQKLDVNGDVRIRGGSPEQGTVLTATNSSGDASWEKPGRGEFNSGSVTAGNWYRIASNSGNRANAMFTLRDYISGGGHSTMQFRLGTSYNYASGISFTMLNHNKYSSATFTKVRVLRNGTYDPQYVEVYISRSGNVDYSITDNLQSAGWVPVDWTAGSIPSGYSVTEYDVDHLFVVGDSDDRFTIERGGNVGIGNSNPSYTLHVNGKVKSDGITETSDIRLKKNVHRLENALEKVLAMNGVSYEWKTEEFEAMNLEEGKQVGVIAQEIEKIFPEVVNTDDDGYKSVEYSHLVPLLIEAIKDQQQIIEQQNVRIANFTDIVSKQLGLTVSQEEALINQTPTD